MSLKHSGKAHHSPEECRRAIKFHEHALKDSQVQGDHEGQAIALCRLGLLHQWLKHYDQALVYQDQSLKLFRELGDHYNEACCLYNLGNVHGYLEKYDDAITLFERSLDLFRTLSIDSRKEEISVLQSLGAAHHRLGHFKTGCKVAVQSVTLSQSLDLSAEKYPIPKWSKAIVRFCQKGMVQLMLCIVVGILGFPLFLIFFIALILWRKVANLWKPSTSSQNTDIL